MQFIEERYTKVHFVDAHQNLRSSVVCLRI